MKRVLVATLALAVATSTASLSAAETRRVTDRQRDSISLDIAHVREESAAADPSRIHRSVAVADEAAVPGAQPKPPIIATGRPVSHKVLIIIGLSVVALWIYVKLTVPYT